MVLAELVNGIADILLKIFNKKKKKDKSKEGKNGSKGMGKRKDRKQ